MMQWSIEIKFEIAAPPAEVRAKFLDFSQTLNWSPDGFIRKVSPIAPATELKLVAGEPIEVQLAMGTFKSVIIKNTAEEFVWRARMPYIFTGTHHFQFTPSSTPGFTTFTQVEYFTGAFGWIMGENILARMMGMREGTKLKWIAFDKDLKAEMEKGRS